MIGGWYLIGLASAVALAGQSVGIKRLRRSMRTDVLMGAVWLGAAGLLAIVQRPAWGAMTPLVLLLLLIAGTASWLGMTAYVAAIERQPNLGLVEVLTALRAPLVYVATVIGLSGTTSALKTLALGGTVMAAALVAPTDGDSITPPATDPARRSRSWVWWSLAAAVEFAILLVATRLAIEQGCSVNDATITTLGLAGLAFVASAALRGPRGVTQGRDGRAAVVLLATIACAAFGNLALYSSLRDAPNPAYPAALGNLRMLFLYGIAVWAQADRISPRKVAGVLIMIIAAAMLA